MSIQSKIDQRITKLNQVRELLADPEMLALIKEVVTEDGAEPTASNLPPIQLPVPQTPAEPPEPAWNFRGWMTQTAYQCVLKMNQPFTGRELIEKMREAGYTFFGHPEVSIHTPLKKLIKENVLEIVEQGAGRHATVYQRRRK
jgi:hypothetical protein